jgi:hypothetical protein
MAHPGRMACLLLFAMWRITYQNITSMKNSKGSTVRRHGGGRDRAAPRWLKIGTIVGFFAGGRSRRFRRVPRRGLVRPDGWTGGTGSASLRHRLQSVIVGPLRLNKRVAGSRGLRNAKRLARLRKKARLPGRALTIYPALSLRIRTCSSEPRGRYRPLF